MNENKNYFMKYKTFWILTFCMIIIILIETGTTVGVYFALKNADDNVIQDKMKVIGDNIINEFDKSIDQLKFDIMEIAAFFRINGPYMSKNQYFDMLQLEFSPLIDMVESNFWIYKLEESELDSFQNFCNKSIKPNCTIMDYNTTSGQLVPSSQKPYYWPVIFYQSSTNQRLADILIGLDFYTFPATKYIIDNELNTQTNFTMSFRITLTAPTKNPNNHGVLISVISYKNISNRSIDNMYGMVWKVIKVGNAFDNAIGKINISVSRNDIDLFVFDTTNDGFANNTIFNISLLYKENKPEYSNIWFANNMTNSYSIINYVHRRLGRNWTIYFKFSADFINESKNDQVIIITSIMAALFFLVDLLIIIISLLFDTILKREKSEKEKKTTAVQMLSYVNHEVRNPLNVIKGLVMLTLDVLRAYDSGNNADLQTLANTSLDTLISDLSTVASACDMLEHIVTDILDIRKLESKKLDLDNKNVNVDEFIKDLYKTILQKLNEKQLEFRLQYDKSLVIFIDNYRLKQILLNYLTNAIKYTDEGYIALKIETIKNNMRFSVVDTGRGIPEENKNKIFQPFSQIKVEDSTRYGGIGLGLYLCKMLTERMGGTIGFDSEFGKGSTFWSEFPIGNLEKHNETSIEIK